MGLNCFLSLHGLCFTGDRSKTIWTSQTVCKSQSRSQVQPEMQHDDTACASVLQQPTLGRPQDADHFRCSLQTHNCCAMLFAALYPGCTSSSDPREFGQSDAVTTTRLFFPRVCGARLSLPTAAA